MLTASGWTNDRAQSRHASWLAAPSKAILFVPFLLFSATSKFFKAAGSLEDLYALC